jgi:orotate phosphoribosyltransferase
MGLIGEKLLSTYFNSRLLFRVLSALSDPDSPLRPTSLVPSDTSRRMKDYQRELLDICLRNDILKFREEGFVLKSGRLSPYFINAGLFNSGYLLSKLSGAYARAILDLPKQFDFDVLFGPAYKGIPLAVATCQALASLGSDVEYAFNRKEAKDHGEGGNIVGSTLKGKNILIIDDVITSGKAIGEAVDIIRKEGGTLTGILVAVDRQERTRDSSLSAVESLKKELNVNIQAIITLKDIIEFTKETLGAEDAQRLEAYREQYGTEKSK